MRTFRLEESNLSLWRQRRDLLLLLGLAVVTIGAVLYIFPPAFTDSPPAGVEHDWTFQIGTYSFGLVAHRDFTFIACGTGFARLPIPFLPFAGYAFLLASLGLFWVVSRFRRHEHTTA